MEILTANGTDTVDGDEGVRGNATNEGGDGFDIVKDGGGSIDVSEGEEFILFLFEG